MELERRREMRSGPLDDGAARMFAKRSSATMPHARREDPAVTVKRIYEERARFVWLSLQRLGVQPADVGDLAHDVFVVVHRRLHTFNRTSRVTTWLFGICVRVVANYRRRQRRISSEAAIRARANDDTAVEVAADELLARWQERASAEEVLARLSFEKRAVFVMFEIENLSCQQIADVMGVPIGTVYSRLYSARIQIQRIVSAAERGLSP